MPPQPGESVVWIKVEKATFDLVGVILSSLGLTGILVLVALLLGTAIGLSLIIRRRREAALAGFEVASLDLGYRPPLP
jgi:hypothetical protein